MFGKNLVQQALYGNYEFRVLTTQYREASFIGQTVCIDMQAMLGTWHKVPIARPVNVRR